KLPQRMSELALNDRNRSINQLFVCLGQLSANRNSTVPDRLLQLAEGFVNPVRRLEEHDGAAGLPETLKPLSSGFCPSRGEAQESKRIRWKAGYRESRHGCAGSRNRYDMDTGVYRLPNQMDAGIGYGRRARVRYQGDIVALLKPLD